MTGLTLCFLPGCLPNITRNAIVNCAELVTYDLIKELILKYGLMTGEELQNLLLLLKMPLKDVAQLAFLSRPR